jgi:hypothetical protein
MLESWYCLRQSQLFCALGAGWLRTREEVTDHRSHNSVSLLVHELVYVLGSLTFFTSEYKCSDVHYLYHRLLRRNSLAPTVTIEISNGQKSKFKFPNHVTAPNFLFTNGQNFKFELLKHSTAPNFPLMFKLPRPSLTYYLNAH